jgi:NAD(P)-dependent dehydrogenase (short-subunit alcohol dehydrogenase family)
MSEHDKFRLDGKVAIVTGASSGLGVAFALEFAQAGASLVVAGRRLEKLLITQQQVQDLGQSAMAFQADITQPEECHALVRATVERFGAVNILINNAGVGTAIPAVRETPDQFRAVIETNLMGSYWMAQSCARVMKSGSSIINVSSVLAFKSVQLPQAAYTASKAAVVGLTRDLAQQWSGRKGIRVNAVAPGYFATEMTDEMDAEFLATFIEQAVPMRRFGRLDECAAAVVFLASDAASFVTGTCLAVDGGLLTG